MINTSSAEIKNPASSSHSCFAVLHIIVGLSHQSRFTGKVLSTLNANDRFWSVREAVGMTLKRGNSLDLADFGQPQDWAEFGVSTSQRQDAETQQAAESRGEDRSYSP